MLRPAIFLLLILAFPSRGSAQKEYHLDEKTSIRISPDYPGQKVMVEVNNSGKQQELDLTESLTRTDRHITVADYNFDGTKDFSVSVADDGQGVYHIYDVFIYDKNKKTFYPLAYPSDGALQCEQFCDLKVNATARTLSSSCRGGAAWHKDVFRYAKDGSLYVVRQKEKAEKEEPEAKDDSRDDE